MKDDLQCVLPLSVDRKQNNKKTDAFKVETAKDKRFRSPRSMKNKDTRRCFVVIFSDRNDRCFFIDRRKNVSQRRNFLNSTGC